MTIGLSFIGVAREYLEIHFDVQSAHDWTSQRDDVINFMSNTGSFRQTDSFSVDGPDDRVVSPLGRSLQFDRITSSDQRVDAFRVGLSPTPIIASMAVCVECVPFLPIVATSSAVLFRPIRECVGVFLFPFCAVPFNAVSAHVRQAIWRCASTCELYMMQSSMACTAFFQTGDSNRGLGGAFRCEHRITKMRATHLAGVFHAVRAARRSLASYATSFVKRVERLDLQASRASLRDRPMLHRVYYGCCLAA